MNGGAFVLSISLFFFSSFSAKCKTDLCCCRALRAEAVFHYFIFLSVSPLPCEINKVRKRGQQYQSVLVNNVISNDDTR